LERAPHDDVTSDARSPERRPTSKDVRKSRERRPTGQHTFVLARLPHWDRVTWPEYLFAFALIAAPLALGSVHVLAQIVLASVLLVAFAGAAWKLSREGREVRVGWVGIGLFVALGWSFLQWLPLPAALVEALSPAAFEARRMAAELANMAVPDWMSLTLDAGRAAAGIVSLLAVTLAYLTATSLRQDSNARARITNYVELAALGVLASAIVHHGLGLTAIWGIYAPVTSGLPEFASSFVNPNHAAALMMLGALVAFGASLSPERSQRWHLVVGVLLSVGVLVSMSRANALLLIVGLIVLTVPPLFLRRFRSDRARLVRLLAGALCCLFVALVLIGPERWLGEFATLEDKGLSGQGVFTYCWSVAGDVLGVAPWTGVGPGNFGVASTPFIGPLQQGYLAYAHNGVQQVLADLGLVVGGLVLMLVAAGFVRAAARGLRGTSEELPLWAGAVALACLALQNLVDFSLWIPGVAVPAAAVLGLVVEWSWDVRGTSRRWLNPAWRWPLWALLIPLGILIVTAVPAHRERPEGWKAEALDALASKDPGTLATIDRSGLVLAHPHDYLAFDFAAALANGAGQREEAVRWLGRALVLAPNDGPTLEAAVRQRLRMKDEVGALALVERLDPGGTGDLRAVALVLDAATSKVLHEGFFARYPQRAISAARELAARAQSAATTTTSRALSLQLDGQADKLLRWALARFPTSLELHRELGKRHWGDATALARLASTCLSKAGEQPVETPERARWERLGYLFQARVEALQGRFLSAYQLYLAAAGAVLKESAEPLLEAGKIAASLDRRDWLDDTIKRLADLPIEGAWPRGEYHMLRSQQAERQSDLTVAIREMHEVLRTLGHVASMHDRLAELYQHAGDPEAAARARARARALDTAPPPGSTP